MDKQAWIVVTLCLVGLVSWQIYFSSKYPPLPVTPKAPPAVAGATPGTGATPAPARESLPAVTSGKPDFVDDRKETGPAAAPATPAAPEQTEVVTTRQIELHFTSLGGGIADAIPLGKEHIVEDGKDIQLNHAGRIPIGALSLKPGEDTDEPYTLRREGDKVTAERTRPDGLQITKEFTLDWQGDPKQIPAIHLKVSYRNPGAQPYRNGGFYIYAGSASPIHRRDLPTYLSFDWLSDGKYHTDHATSFDSGHVPLVGVQTHAARPIITTALTKVAWVAVKNQFYTTVLTPLETQPDQEPPAREIWARRFDLPLTPQETAENAQPLHGLDVALGLPALDLAPGETKAQDFQIYAGPKFYSRLDKLGHQEQEVMDFGKFKIVSITLLGLMNLFKSWFGSYAVAIILLTIMVKGILFPLQNKANKSMKRMSALNPLLTELRAKYKEDPTRLNTETMKLYKTHGVNPLGGCWPMFIQMPIFFGFLYMLYTAAELRNSGFLWVHDLSQPDTVTRLLIPGFGMIPINVLPLLMIGAQFWQMTLTPKTGDPTQQKTLMFMPLLFGFFCYNFAAALALYYTMQTLLTILQLYLTRTQNNAAGGPGAPQAVRVSGDPGPAPVRSSGGSRKGSGNRYPGR